MSDFNGRYCRLCGSQEWTYICEDNAPVQQCDGCGAFLRTDDPPSSPPDADLTLDVDTMRLYTDECIAEELQEAAELEDERRRLGLWA